MEGNARGVTVNGSLDNESVSRLTKEIFEWGSSLLFAFSACFFITIFVMFFTVSGDSMLQTLHDGDKLLVYKFMYTPKRGDIVTIDTNEQLGKNIIKRVVGLPGDTVKIDYDKHKVYVNGQVLKEDYINEPTALRGDGAILNNTLYCVPDGRSCVFGDNRNRSMDSRFEKIGFVNINKFYGVAFLRYWPFESFRIFS